MKVHWKAMYGACKAKYADLLSAHTKLGMEYNKVVSDMENMKDTMNKEKEALQNQVQDTQELHTERMSALSQYVEGRVRTLAAELDYLNDHALSQSQTVVGFWQQLCELADELTEARLEDPIEFSPIIGSRKDK